MSELGECAHCFYVLSMQAHFYWKNSKCSMSVNFNAHTPLLEKTKRQTSKAQLAASLAACGSFLPLVRPDVARKVRLDLRVRRVSPRRRRVGLLALLPPARHRLAVPPHQPCQPQPPLRIRKASAALRVQRWLAHAWAARMRRRGGRGCGACTRRGGSCR